MSSWYSRSDPRISNNRLWSRHYRPGPAELCCCQPEVPGGAWRGVWEAALKTTAPLNRAKRFNLFLNTSHYKESLCWADWKDTCWCLSCGFPTTSCCCSSVVPVCDCSSSLTPACTAGSDHIHWDTPRNRTFASILTPLPVTGTQNNWQIWN